MRPLALAVHHHPCALTKIHLRFGSRLHLHSHKRDRLTLSQLPHEPFDRLIAATEPVLAHQILIDPLSTESHHPAVLILKLGGAIGRIGESIGGKK